MEWLPFMQLHVISINRFRQCAHGLGHLVTFLWEASDGSCNISGSPGLLYPSRCRFLPFFWSRGL